ncbi:MAG: hypothetical protein GY720_10450, partial [bacterium]|nr:hypothetical protein [bacterium]
MNDRRTKTAVIVFAAGLLLTVAASAENRGLDQNQSSTNLVVETSSGGGYELTPAQNQPPAVVSRGGDYALLPSSALLGEKAVVSAEVWRSGFTMEDLVITPDTSSGYLTSTNGRLLGPVSTFRSGRVEHIYHVFPMPVEKKVVRSVSYYLLSRSGSYSSGNANMSLEVFSVDGNLQHTVSINSVDLETADSGIWSSVSLSATFDDLQVDPGEYLAFHVNFDAGPADDLRVDAVFEVEVDHNYVAPLLDFGDAPDSYATLGASDGARHEVPVSGGVVFLGKGVDTELDGQPSATAQGDDANGDDEDGVTMPALLMVGADIDIDVVASATGTLNAWLDFNNDGDWADAGEQIFTNQALPMGSNALSFQVPAGATSAATFARFRFSTTSGLLPTGLADDGEVEDMQVTIAPPRIVSVDGLGTGTGTTSGGTTISCVSTAGIESGTCTESVPDGTVVTLTATPSLGSNFTGWTGCDSPSGNVCTQTVSGGDETVQPNFGSVPIRMVSVDGVGTGTGTTSGGATISCFSIAGVESGTCSESVSDGTVVTLTATPSVGSNFTGWTGCDSPSGNVCTQTVSGGDETVQPN